MKIADLCKTSAGGTPLKSNKAFYDGGDIPWLLSGEVNNKNITSTKNFITKAGLDGSSAKIFPIGTVLIAMYGATAGEVGILNCEASTNQAVCGILPSNEVLSEYLYYFFLNHKALLVAQAVGNAQPNISQQKIKNTEIDLPSKVDQKRIVATLDQAFADIEQAHAKTERNLKNARELFESYLQQVFSQRGEGWENKKISEIADTCLGKMLDKKKNKGSPKPYLRNLNVQWFDISTDDLLEMRFEDSEYERYAIKKGDLVLCEGGYPGRGAIWNKDEDIFFQKALHRVRCHNVIYNRWVLYYFFLSDCDGSLRSHFTGAGIQHFTGKALKQLSLPVPPESVAKQYLEKIDELHNQVTLLEAVYEKKLQQLDELKKSILQKAFSGELTKDSKGVVV